MSERMLVVEDEENVRESVAALLEVEGHEVLTANNGAEALAVLRNGPPVALIFLDLMMPQMDGWAFRARQLNQPQFRDIPVVVLSGAHEIEREVATLEPAAVLRKPVGIQELLDVIKQATGAHTKPK